MLSIWIYFHVLVTYIYVLSEGMYVVAPVSMRALPFQSFIGKPYKSRVIMEMCIHARARILWGEGYLGRMK